jgi:serine/threonine protein kinase
MDNIPSELALTFTTRGYSFDNRIGRGGFASVFKAFKIATEEVVAIKVIDAG